MNEAFMSTGGTVTLQKARLNKELKKRAEQRKKEKIEKAAAKERKKREKEERRQKDIADGKLTRTQSAKKYLTDKSNKAYYGNFQEKYISIYGEGKSDKDAKYGTVWKQIYSVRKDYFDNDDDNTENEEIKNKLEQAGVTDVVKIEDKYADYIKYGKIRQKNITGKDYIIIPYENAEFMYELLIKGELDKNTKPDEYNIREFKQGEYTRITQTKNDLEYYYYYIPVVIKEHVRFAKIMKYYQDKENSDEKEKKKKKKRMLELRRIIKKEIISRKNLIKI